jgi:hypothetical protein
VLATIAAGRRIPAGASAAVSPIAVPSAVAVNLAAARRPSVTTTMTTSTARAGQAVYFIAQTTPRATAGCQPLPPNLISSASARQVRAITGGSVMPSASGNAITGEEIASAARPAGVTGIPPIRLILLILKAANRSRKVTAASQGRGSASRPGRPSAFGSPKTAITGR